MNQRTFDDLTIDLDRLHKLLETSSDLIREMPFERDGERDARLDRIAALVGVAQDMAQRLTVECDEQNLPTSAAHLAGEHVSQQVN